MPTELTLNTARTAVLGMDCQAGIVTIYVQDRDPFLARAASVLQAARDAGMLVIHVQVGFRPNLPEVSSRNPLFSAIKSSSQHQQLFQGKAGEIHPGLGRQDRDIVVTKHRIGAFTGTDLDMILRANEIDTLILFGIATSGVVLATLLQGADADYRLFVIKDCCADLDPDVHACLLEKLFPHLATVTTADQIVSAVHSGFRPAPLQ